MLRIIQQQSAAGAKSYYSQSDYYTEGHELAGKWSGKAAAMLGLSGEVQKSDFDRLCDNQDPRSGDRLTLRNRANRSVGYDFNWHVPKGVSLAYSLNHDDRIVGVLEQSIAVTMREIEADSSTRVRKHDQMDERRTSNLAWATFVHTTARPVDGEPDPHLHAHCFVFNSTWDDVENSWKAVQFRDLKRDAPYYEAAFEARFASGLKDLGYTIQRKDKSWDLKGLQPDTLKKFSRRTAEIDKLAEELGIHDPAEKDALGAKTRAKKEKNLPVGELCNRWFDRLNEQEKVDLNDLLSQGGNTTTDPLSRAVEAIKHAKLHCFERDSIVPERKLVAEALRFGVGDVEVEEVRRQMHAQGVISRDLHGRRWVTTPEVLVEETAMLNIAKKGVNSQTPLNPTWEVKGDWLNKDQRNAISHVHNSTDKIMIIRGGAGTGKTSLMRESIKGIEANGKKVFTFAPSAQASRGVLVSEGFDATTVAELLVSQKLQEEITHNVIWIDEAGLLGTRVLKQVMDLAERHDARLILSGDWKQHGSVERGAALRLLEQEGGIKPALVNRIVRQKGEYREAISKLAEGDIFGALEDFQKLNWIHEIEDADARYSAMASSFANGIECGEKVLAVTPTHSEASTLTTRIRDELKSREIITGEERDVAQLKPMYLTEAERKDPFEVTKGDVMVFHRGNAHVKKGERFEATEDNASRFKNHASQFDVYRRSSFKLAKGDLIRITQNGKTKNGMHALNNGQVFTIKGFSDAGDFVLNNNWIVSQDYGFLAPGYVSTSHSSQGKTVDRVLIAESAMSYAAADHAQFYVSVSRGEKKAEIYTDEMIGLMDAVSRHQPRVSATELVRNRDIPRIVRQQQIVEAVRNATPKNEKDWEVVYERA